MKISAIIPAAGTGSRYGKDKNKLFEEISGIPVIAKTLKTISEVDEINEIIVCTSPEMIDDIKGIVDFYNIQKISKIIRGGATRQESVYNGLKHCINTDYALIHDGARPFITTDIIKKAIDKALATGAAIVAVPSKDTIKEVNENFEIVKTPDRSRLWNVQTPQVFRYDDIISAHKKYAGMDFTDDSALIEQTGLKVYVVKGSYGNIKITTPEDIKIANALE